MPMPRATTSGAYRLPVEGLVDRPHTFTLAELRAMPQLAQITRHDCVEGWSQIGKWQGVPLATVIAMAQPKANARYVIFSCFDKDESGTEYYESLDLHEAAHPQTLLALDLNDKPLDPDHGAPVRLRIPTQLGYKSAKWVRKIELADAFPTPQSKGGYWEDQGLRMVRRHLAVSSSRACRGTRGSRRELVERVERSVQHRGSSALEAYSTAIDVAREQHRERRDGRFPESGHRVR